MQKLNFNPYSFRLRNDGNNVSIFDEIRKKFVVLQPEEWVRQHVISYLTEEKGYPKSLINVEKELTVGSRTKRYDVVVYTPAGTIDVVVECKAPSVPITQRVFDQIARYNLTLQARNLMVTNGLEHYFCQMDYLENRYIFLRDLPKYHKMDTGISNI
ncbi:MAG: type I restriction enzyme HsdR N-terminal domain-containing protein [Capnocytophaga sp.]|nr:type I restriction enzyme HsdR N-terminal domain-containing protein [Capnocytophaga sp.]